MTPVTLNDDVFAEILLRLPPKSVLRFRAVCKLWRSITTSAPFIAAYNRRQSLELLLICPDNSYILDTGGENAVAAVVPLDGTGTGCRRLLRHSATLKLFGSCDGLLLFSQHYESFLVCNPATRQWASLPAPTPRPCFWAVPSGFYHHRPSGEYRVLCFGQEVLYVRDPLTGVYGPPADSQRPLDQCYRVHYVLSTGGNTEPRRLGPMERRPGPAYNSIPAFGVAVGGILYWNKHPQIGKTSKMLAFDTVTEAFRRMPLPSVTGREYRDLSLFDMHGTLAASVVAEWPYLQVWALDGVGESTWSRRLCVELPAMQGQRRSWLFGTEDTELSRLFVDMEPFAPPDRGPSRLLNEAVAGLDGDTLVVFASGWVVLYDMKEKKMVSKVDHNHNCSRMWWCVHRESLVPVLKSQPSPDGKPILHFPDNLLEGQPAPDGEPAILAFPSQIQDATTSLVPDLL